MSGEPTPLVSTDVSLPSEPKEAEPAGAHSKGGSRAAAEWFAIIAIAVVLTVVGRHYVFQAYYIPSPSMTPTLAPGDRVIVSKLSYDLHTVHRGDIVVFARPPTENNLSIKDLIKRVVGLPGDTIVSAPGGQLLVNGHILTQPWLTPTAIANPGVAVTKQTLAAGTYFVMGDNRGNSADSRYIGPISGSLIVGKAVLRVWPLDGITGF